MALDRIDHPPQFNHVAVYVLYSDSSIPIPNSKEGDALQLLVDRAKDRKAAGANDDFLCVIVNRYEMELIWACDAFERLGFPNVDFMKIQFNPCLTTPVERLDSDLEDQLTEDEIEDAIRIREELDAIEYGRTQVPLAIDSWLKHQHPKAERSKWPNEYYAAGFEWVGLECSF